jgi:hypothetical protein
MDNVFIRFRVAEVVVYIPPERLEEGVKELPAQFGLVVTIGAEIVGISPEVLNQIEDSLWRVHLRDTLIHSEGCG